MSQAGIGRCLRGQGTFLHTSAAEFAASAFMIGQDDMDAPNMVPDGAAMVPNPETPQGNLSEGTNNSKPIIEILTGEELIDRSWKSPNEDIFGGRLKYLGGQVRSELHVTAVLGTLIVGVGSLQENPFDSNVVWVKAVSVDPAYQGRGYGRMIAEATRDLVLREGKKVHPSTFSVQGARRLKPLFRHFSAQYPHAICDCSTCREHLL